MTEIRHEPRASTIIRPLVAGSGIDPHRHDDHQVVYAGRGVLAVTTDRGRWVAPATRAIWIPAGTVHAHQAYGDVELHLVGLSATSNPLRWAEPSVIAVPPLLRELIIAYTRPPHTNSAERRRLRGVLLDQLRAAPERPLCLPVPSDPRLKEVATILNDEPDGRHSLSELGQRVGASERTLSRLITSELGMTFPQWRTQYRLYHALIMLADGVAVTTVAHACGWSSSSAFIEAFRRTFGHTPGRHS